jgi:hypothetical protein
MKHLSTTARRVATVIAAASLTGLPPILPGVGTING